jgi:hypothetical protein
MDNGANHYPLIFVQNTEGYRKLSIIQQRQTGTCFKAHSRLSFSLVSENDSCQLRSVSLKMRWAASKIDVSRMLIIPPSGPGS